jgi:hypothetical protein
MADTIDDAIENAVSDQPELIIDGALRTIQTPPNFLLGVFFDKNTRVVTFSAPSEIYGTGIYSFDIYIHFQNALNDIFESAAVNKRIIGDRVLFDWVVPREAYLKAGNVKFSCCFKSMVLANDEIIVDQEYNTTIASGEVLPGLEVNTNVNQ